jgi:hypothetical protein
VPACSDDGDGNGGKAGSAGADSGADAGPVVCGGQTCTTWLGDILA